MRSQKARLPPPGAGIAQTSTLWSRSIMPAKTLKPEPAKCSVTVLHLDRVAQVRLVGAVFAHRLAIGNAREFLRHRLAVGESLEDAADHRLHRREDVVLRDEAHLDVELVEFARQPVGARILVAEAGRDLEIAVEARHHDQLLELLRRLRQRVELSRMQPRRHEEVARALRRGGGQDRRLELVEAGRAHQLAHLRDDRRRGA